MRRLTSSPNYMYSKLIGEIFKVVHRLNRAQCQSLIIELKHSYIWPHSFRTMLNERDNPCLFLTNIHIFHLSLQRVVFLGCWFVFCLLLLLLGLWLFVNRRRFNIFREVHAFGHKRLEYCWKSNPFFRLIVLQQRTNSSRYCAHCGIQHVNKLGLKRYKKVFR